MTFINTDGMAFIGPGSEWFWAALTGIVLAVTFIAISRQLRMQAHASAIEQVESFVREANSELMSRYVVEVLVALRDRKDPTDLPTAAVSHVAGFFDRFATLARAGHRDVKLLWRSNPTEVQNVWATLAPWVRKLRAESGDPSIGQDFEWLAGVMAELDRQAGRAAITPANATGRIGGWIPRYQEQIRVAQELRTVIFAAPETVTARGPKERKRPLSQRPVGDLA